MMNMRRISTRSVLRRRLRTYVMINAVIIINPHTYKRVQTEKLWMGRVGCLGEYDRRWNALLQDEGTHGRRVRKVDWHSAGEYMQRGYRWTW